MLRHTSANNSTSSNQLFIHFKRLQRQNWATTRRRCFPDFMLARIPKWMWHPSPSVENDLFLSNTVFWKRRARNITTWQDIRRRGPIFNQIDYIILPLRSKLFLPIHNLGAGHSLTAIIGLQAHIFSCPMSILMHISRTQPWTLTFDTALFRDPDLLDLYQQPITNELLASTPASSLGWP